MVICFCRVPCSGSLTNGWMDVWQRAVCVFVCLCVSGWWLCFGRASVLVTVCFIQCSEMSCRKKKLANVKRVRMMV